MFPRASASRLVRQLRGGPKTTSRHAPAARPTCRRSCPPLLRECRRDRGIFGGSPPLARKRPPNMASWLLAVTSLIAGVAARKPDHGTRFGEDNHGAAERAAMFAQMRFCMDYSTEPATGSNQPARPDRRRSPPTELTGGGLIRAQLRQARTRSSARMQERLSCPAHLRLGGRTGLQLIGDFWRVTPLARKEATKRGLLLPVITSRSRVSRVEMLIRRCRGFNSMPR